MRPQLWDPSGLDRENYVLDGLGNGDQEFGRTASVSGKPIDHPRVGIMILRFQQRAVRGDGPPVRVCEPSSVLVVRIAWVPVLKWRLGEPK